MGYYRPFTQVTRTTNSIRLTSIWSSAVLLLADILLLTKLAICSAIQKLNSERQKIAASSPGHIFLFIKKNNVVGTWHFFLFCWPGWRNECCDAVFTGRDRRDFERLVNYKLIWLKAWEITMWSPFSSASTVSILPRKKLYVTRLCTFSRTISTRVIFHTSLLL